MNRISLGAMIEKIRKEQKISQKTLSQGLCSVQTLSKIEGDLCETDTLLLDILLQRLGKSPDKLELILPQIEYKRIRIRDFIETLIWKRKEKKAEALLNFYKTQFEKNNHAQMMFCYRTNARIAYYLKQDLPSAKQYLLDALETTMHGWREETLFQYQISTIEMENLLMLIQILLEQENETAAESLLSVCILYIQKHFTDEEEYTKIFSKAAWLQARIWLKQKLPYKALTICETAMEHLRKNGISYFMLPLLELMSACFRMEGTKQNQWIQWYECYLELYQEFCEPWYCHDDLFHNCYQREYHLDYEIIRGERLSKGYTQFELIDAIYQSPETLSRVETGKVSPTKHNFEQLMQKLNLNRKRYDGAILVDSFELLELKQQIDREINRREYVKGKLLLDQLKTKLDLKQIQNHQFIEGLEHTILFRTGKLSAEAYEQASKKSLSYTYSIEKAPFFRPPLKNECVLISQICNASFDMNRWEETFSLCDSAIQSFFHSKVDLRYHYRSLGLLLANRIIFTANHLNETTAKPISGCSIRYELLCGKGNFLPAELISYARYLKKENDHYRSDIKIKQAYYVSLLFYQTTYEAFIEKMMSGLVKE